MGGIRKNKSIKSKLTSQKIRDQFRRQCCRHNILILYTRTKLSGVFRQRNMTRHNALNSAVDHFLINMTESRIPLITLHCIYTHNKMLIQFLNSIAWEMFAANSKSAFPDTSHICLCIFYYQFRILAICSGIYDRIAPVIKKITNRAKIPVASHSCSFSSAHISYAVSSTVIIRSSTCRRRGYIRSSAAGSVTAVVAVARD